MGPDVCAMTEVEEELTGSLLPSEVALSAGAAAGSSRPRPSLLSCDNEVADEGAVRAATPDPDILLAVSHQRHMQAGQRPGCTRRAGEDIDRVHTC